MILLINQTTPQQQQKTKIFMTAKKNVKSTFYDYYDDDDDDIVMTNLKLCETRVIVFGSSFIFRLVLRVMSDQGMDFVAIICLNARKNEKLNN